MAAPKIAVIGVPLYGHVNPVAPLLQALNGRGVEVHYYNTERFRWVAEKAGGQFTPYRSLLETHPYAHPALVFLHREIPNAVYQLEERLLQQQYDLLLYDSFCLWTKYLAVRHKLPAVELFTTYPNSRTREVDPERTVHLEGENASLFYIQKFNLSVFTVDYRDRKYGPKGIGLHDLRLVEAALGSMNRPEGITADQVIDRPAPLNLVFVPEAFLSGKPDKPGARYYFLPSLYELEPNKRRNEEKFVYASFGTRSRIIERLIAAWLRNSAPRTVRLHAVAGGDAESLQHYSGPNLTIENYAEQHALLAQAEAFITHGGMNGVMEAILTETPMLVIPLTLEQQITANNIHRFQLGKVMPLKKLETTDLQHRVAELTGDAVVRENLKNWRAKIIDAGGARRAVELITHWLESKDEARWS